MRLADLTTLRLGGPAREYVRVETEAELIDAVRADDVLIVAGGSNLVVADTGWDGRVVHVATRGTERSGREWTVAAGEPWDAVVAASVDAGLAGIECLSGIPGSTGATPIQNVGAYGQEVADTITSVRVYDRADGEVVTLAADECGFVYRGSRFKYHDRFVVLTVTFALFDEPRPVRYAGVDGTLAERRAAVLALRSGKGMVVSPEDPDSVSAGSFFTNPVVDAAPEGAPAWPQPDGRVKTSAAWLIEQAGFQRGWGDGPAGISTKHTLALVNRGGATTAELLTAARTVRDGVRERFGIELHPEPVLVGVAF